MISVKIHTATACSDVDVADDDQSVADRGGSGPWGPQFCVALCKGVIQRLGLPAGGLGRCKHLAGSGAEPRRQTHFRNNY